MTCDEARILLHALLDNELDAGHAREVEAHIASCPDCAAEFAAQREMQRVLADTVGAPVGTVMSRLARARAMLRAAWMAEEEHLR